MSSIWFSYTCFLPKCSKFDRLRSRMRAVQICMLYIKNEKCKNRLVVSNWIMNIKKSETGVVSHGAARRDRCCSHKKKNSRIVNVNQLPSPLHSGLYISLSLLPSLPPSAQGHPGPELHACLKDLSSKMVVPAKDLSTTNCRDHHFSYLEASFGD